ncbi:MULTISPECIES: hypothetical protein [Bradyrhizobium]|uniref:hypothetical protein n=1 Tax=Bradyrhizobium TaxID=374 RepID=UPI00155F4A65|nr:MULTISPECIES: hypothetical protein [Bradyrhizobium]MDD1564903.1 hypothetical protein [Bradyrhizobium sp. WBAH33]QCJ86004.1 hypothetical protein DAA53_36720 [Bradyrhizobium sp. WBAH23]UUO32218.1 hypothetical protein DCG74_36035 [Bradyrhizobium sp. WBAH42]
MTVQALAEKIWGDANLQTAIEAITLRSVIRLATQRLASEFSEFMEYAKSRAIRTRSRFYEYLLSYLVFRQIDYGTLASSPSVHGLSQDQLDIL